jgi:hypothetical protein
MSTDFKQITQCTEISRTKSTDTTDLRWVRALDKVVRLLNRGAWFALHEEQRLFKA